MQILDYKHIPPTERREGYFAIPELDRECSSVNQFIELANLNVELTVPTGVIYIDGFTITQAETGIGLTTSNKYTVAVCSGTSYVMHKWISSFGNPELVTRATSTTGTCASSLQALNLASEWLQSGVCKEVIVVGGERITKDTVRLFKELRIPLMCGDGFAYMRLGAEGNDIADTTWKFAYNKNPFAFTRDVLNNLTPGFPVDYVKLHATGSKSNTEAEQDLALLGVPLALKTVIGHTQGISGLLETCIVLSDATIKGKVLVVANGVGGFYGSCVLNRQ